MTHDQIREMVRRVNPIPDPSLLKVDVPVFTTSLERRTEMQVDERPGTEVQVGRNRWRGPLVGIATALVVVLTVGGLYFAFGGGDGQAVDQSTVPTPTTVLEPEPETTTPLSEAGVTELLNGFVEARVAGEGAQQYLSVPEEEVPLLYATSSGAPYERAEFERVLGIEWPYGFEAFKVRLFAGDTVVEQLLFMGADVRLDLEYVQDGFATHIAPTTENGQPVAALYDFFDGEVTLHAAHPWVFHDGSIYGALIPEDPGVRPTTDGGERHDWDHLWLLADPLPVETGCQAGPAPADAEALAESMRSDPDLDATAPIAVSVGEVRALMMDVVIAAGASICEYYGRPEAMTNEQAEPLDIGLATGDRMRLYMFDMPEGSSMRILAIAIVAPESSFERAVEAAAPVVDSVEFNEE